MSEMSFTKIKSARHIDVVIDLKISTINSSFYLLKCKCKAP